MRSTLVETAIIATPVIEAGGAGEFVGGHPLRHVELAVVLQVGGGSVARKAWRPIAVAMPAPAARAAG